MSSACSTSACSTWTGWRTRPRRRFRSPAGAPSATAACATARVGLGRARRGLRVGRGRDLVEGERVPVYVRAPGGMRSHRRHARNRRGCGRAAARHGVGHGRVGTHRRRRVVTRRRGRGRRLRRDRGGSRARTRPGQQRRRAPRRPGHALERRGLAGGDANQSLRRLPLHAPRAGLDAQGALGAHRQRLLGLGRAPTPGQATTPRRPDCSPSPVRWREMARKWNTATSRSGGRRHRHDRRDLDDLLPLVPAGRAGTPGDVAWPASASCSEEASYVNGATLVDGALAA